MPAATPSTIASTGCVAQNGTSHTNKTNVPRLRASPRMLTLGNNSVRRQGKPVHPLLWCSWMERGAARGHMGRVSIEV